MDQSNYLKKLESKAFRSFYKDGIWDIFFALMMLGMYTFTVMDKIENPTFRTLGMLFIDLFAIFFPIFGKKYITVPRLGEVNFAPHRKRRLLYVFLVNSAALLIGIGAFFLFNNGQAAPNPDMRDTIIPIGMGVWIAFLTSLMAYFLEFDRLYLYAFIYGLTFALVLLFDIPILFLFAGLMILLPGMVLLVKFLRDYKPNQRA